MFDVDSINLKVVGGDNIPLTSTSQINEAKASMMILNLYYQGSIARYADTSVLSDDKMFNCKSNLSYTYKLSGKEIKKNLPYFQIVNGFPFFPFLREKGSGRWQCFIDYAQPSDIEKCPSSLFKLIPERFSSGTYQDSDLNRALHFFKTDSRTFGKFTLKDRFRLASLCESNSAQDEEDSSDIHSFQEKLAFLMKYSFQDSRNFNLECNTKDNDLFLSVDFHDSCGETMMRMAKYFQFKKNRIYKIYVPVTCWFVKHHHPYKELFVRDYCQMMKKSIEIYDNSFFWASVGLPDGQILYNLNLLEKAETVIICNSPENAEALQEANDIEDTGVAFTGFVCDPGQYDEVDFSPLKGKQVYIELSNHNGLSLAESYLEANKLYEHLRNEVKIENIGFIQREIVYPDMDEVCDLDGLVKTAGGNPPLVIKKTVLAFDEQQFIITLKNAQQEIDRKKRDSSDQPFWGAPQPTETSDEETQDEEDPYASLILRPIINRGQTTLIAGMPYAGKTAFSIAMGGYLRGCNNHFLENWYWTRHNKEPQDENSEKKDYKVVYLLFDSGGKTILNKFRKEFCPGIEQNDPLFIMDDLGGNTTDYTQEENYGKFMRILDKYEKDGRKMDVLFIDTAARFANQDHFDIKKLNKFMSFFNSRRPDVALVFVHHAKDEKDMYGGPLALATVRNGCVLFRTKKQCDAVEGTPTLNNPFTIRVKKSLLSANISTDLADFTARTENNEFTAVASDLEQAKRLHEIVDAYTAEDLKRPEIASLLDCSTRSLFNHLKNADQIIAKANAKQKAAQNIEEDL